MDIATIITMVVSVLTTSSVVEVVKWLANRKNKARENDAIADQEETKAEKEEFEYLRDRIAFKEKQLLSAEEREKDKTAEIRRLNTENLELVREITMLKTERAMKLCEVRNCKERVPQSGY